MYFFLQLELNHSVVIESTVKLSHISRVGALNMSIICNNVCVFSWVLNVVLEGWTSITGWNLRKTLCFQVRWIIL